MGLFSNNFYEGVSQIGAGLGGLVGAYSFATSWGTLASISGVLFGTAGVIIGGFLGAIVGCIALSLAVMLIDVVLTMVSGLIASTLSGVGMCLGHSTF